MNTEQVENEPHNVWDARGRLVPQLLASVKALIHLAEDYRDTSPFEDAKRVADILDRVRGVVEAAEGQSC